MVWLDSLASPPVGVLTLTTVDPRDSRDGDRFAKNVEQVIRALRRRWPGLEYLGWVEFTTGRAPRSGSFRRIHLHAFLKGLPDEALSEAQSIARRVWEGRTGAWRVVCEPIRTLRAAVHYLALHHQKPEQAPPEWWSGRRVRVSRGYWSRPATELRSEARANLVEKVRLWLARQQLGDDAPAPDIERALQAMRDEATGRWEVVRVQEDREGRALQPLGRLSDDPPRRKDSDPVTTRYYPGANGALVGHRITVPRYVLDRDTGEVVAIEAVSVLAPAYGYPGPYMLTRYLGADVPDVPPGDWLEAA